MVMNTEERKEFVDELFSMEGKYEIRVNVWHPSDEQLDWLLGKLKVEIHCECAHILNLYDGATQYGSPTEVCVFLGKENIDDIREHPKLKDLYNEWYFNKQKKGGEINESKRKPR